MEQQKCKVHNVPFIERGGAFGTFLGCPTYASTKCSEKGLYVAPEPVDGYSLEVGNPDGTRTVTPAAELAEKARAKAAETRVPTASTAEHSSFSTCNALNNATSLVVNKIVPYEEIGATYKKLLSILESTE